MLLQALLMQIARFFERTSGRRTGYRLYLVSMLLTLTAAARYLWRIPNEPSWPDFTGDPPANLMLFAAGILLIALLTILYDRMVGSAPQ